MKGHMFCASQASTAICLSMDHIHKPTSSAAINDEHVGRAIDRHNPIIKEGRRSFATAPYSSDVDHVPYRQLSGTASDLTNNRKLQLHKGRRSASSRSGGGVASLFKLIADDISVARKSFGCVSTVPVGSSRYLLGSSPGSVFGQSGQDPVDPVEKPSEPKRGSDAVEEIKAEAERVVVLRVSLHCKGCEGKVRKHLSRMPGVTSFNIEFVAKKVTVTVTEDITPLDVLASISKVKSAQLWTPFPQPSSSSSSSSSISRAHHMKT